MPALTMRQCKICGKQFMGHNNGAYCSDAHRQKGAVGDQARYRAANPEKIRDAERRYRAAHREKSAERARRARRKRTAVLAAVRELGLI